MEFRFERWIKDGDVFVARVGDRGHVWVPIRSRNTGTCRVSGRAYGVGDRVFASVDRSGEGGALRIVSPLDDILATAPERSSRYAVRRSGRTCGRVVLR